jgi:murein DD-endopeptidase MepM/ murein hydrolase activator NlpD
MEFFPGFKTFRCAFFFVGLLAVFLTAARAQSAAVTLTPPVVVAGSPELIRVEAGSAESIDGEWLGRKLEFFRGRDGRAWFALAGVDVEAAVGPSTLKITLHLKSGGVRELTETLPIEADHYKTGALTVEPKYVSPGPEELKRIAEDKQIKDNIFAVSAAQPLWSANFRAPVVAEPTDSFGTRRTFNGKLASIHKGMDFRAPSGTPVKAGNSGVVVLARPLYLEGGCVVIDHGLSIYTISMHLSRIDVKEGQKVATGDQLGLSGATGRVTGPHLHWAVRWQGASLDPAKLLRLDLNGVR